MYRSLVHEVTQSFKTISEEAISISKTLCEKYKLNKVAECIDSIQAGEQEKLELTAELQIARQGVVDNPEDESMPAQVAGLQEKLQNVVCRINEHLEDLKYESEDLYTNGEGR
ncbi:hypothetical protein C0Q70_17218 [Pomacea canaliculata]|uniref:Uncharacterized protein n=1 Tax=Pomacea canaliculata TaxID=400727 RepID=A0A2T7NS17_POMCA|nr:required for excision 1-B domain-containing protein-like [Pomacea canaliculata]PVD23942.1 hypothetical protein C0Q70_17218 [Pomacea canaliculata]